jgi:hypothetical protein
VASVPLPLPPRGLAMTLFEDALAHSWGPPSLAAERACMGGPRRPCYLPVAELKVGGYGNLGSGVIME